MKLWLKISLITAVSVSLLMGICSGIFIYQTAHGNVQLATDNYYQRFESTKKFVERYVKNTRIADDVSQLSYEAFLAEAMREHAGAQFALVDRLESDREIYNRTEYLFTTNSAWTDGEHRVGAGVVNDTVHYMIQTEGEESILIVGAYLDTDAFAEEEGRRYYLFGSFDLTDIYENVAVTSVQFLWITLVFTILLTAVISLLVRMILRPVDRLKTAARAVSAGQYGDRIEVWEEDEIGMVSRSFNEMAEQVDAHVRELEEINQRQKLLLGSLTHELKTPMTSIIGYSDTLLHVKLGEKQQKKALMHIHTEGKRMERLSARLMQLIGRYENDVIEKNYGSIKPVVERACAGVQHKLEERDQQLFMRCEDFCIDMDQDLIEELLINLIDNSIKASASGGRIEIHCQAGEIRIVDEGKGIPKEEIQRITDPFYMVDKSRSRSEGGIGLGLYIVQQIVQLHEGSLVIDSRPGEGTTVRVIFYEED